MNWPTRDEALRLTGVVIFLSVALAVFLGAFDYLFSYLLKAFVLKS
ncbi:MAG: SecE/Sec61-gamma subunit of protein translocation complex [Candidatus Parcubacteria bacterium]